MSIVSMESNAYIGMGDLHQVDLPFRSPSIRREPKISGNKLRNLYQTGLHEVLENDGSLGLVIDSTAPVLPLTPPNVEDGGEDDDPSTSETTKVRSVLVTPVNNLSPPTPDITPPRDHHVRHFLGTRPSMTSSYAESFKTAQEDISSQLGSSLSLPGTRRLPALAAGEHRPSPLVQTFFYESDVQEESLAGCSPEVKQGANQIKSLASEKDYDDSAILPSEFLPPLVTGDDLHEPGQARSEMNGDYAKPIARTGPSLRERLEESHVLPRSRSLDKFANIIGWNEGVQAGSNKRWSGVSTSTISAIVVDQPQPWKRRGTLRHVGKQQSLRSASSPLPPPSQLAGHPTPNSPHQLTHKKARLSNRHRESFGSDHSRSLSLGSSVPLRKLEVIKVAVIPERGSSLQQDSASEARRRSRSVSTGSRAAYQQRESERDRLSTGLVDRGRDRYYPPQVGPFTVPIRSSSLSAPTSRTTSRANSLTSESIRSARQQAELDLRSTLNQMESERLASSLQHGSGETGLESPAAPSRLEVKAHDFASGVEANPGHEPPWADFRPPSFHATLHSAPSFLSASPEINEAKAVSFFPHNNHSIQVIEPFHLPDSKAVQLIRQEHTTRTHSESPFREPRIAPTPPREPTDVPPVVTMDDRPRPATARADSFGRMMMRTISLKHARNRKVNQDLDAASHPMWRPRPFWDDADAQKRRLEDRAEQSQDRGLVQNSVGIPQQRGAFAGPVALMHRISNRRRTRKAVVKQSSFTSLHRLRTGRRLYRIPGLGIHLQVMNLKDIQARMATKRLRKEEDRRQERQEQLRETIGTNVISMGDSRFPANFV